VRKNKGLCFVCFYVTGCSIYGDIVASHSCTGEALWSMGNKSKFKIKKSKDDAYFLLFDFLLLT